MRSSERRAAGPALAAGVIALLLGLALPLSARAKGPRNRYRTACRIR